MDPLAYSQQILLPCASPTAQDHGFGMGRAQNTLTLSLLGQKHTVEKQNALSALPLNYLNILA